MTDPISPHLDNLEPIDWHDSESNEYIPSKELKLSEASYEEYLAGRDPGLLLSKEDLESWLANLSSGKKVG